MDNQQIPEGQIGEATMQEVAPDISSPQGQSQLFQKAVQAHVAKKQLDAVMGAVADHLEATTSSRVKNIDTAGKKIVQKRLAGRDEYNIDSLNDMLGSRLVVDKETDIPKAISSMEKLESAGVFDIIKQQRVKTGTYSAYHLDVTLGNGTKAEIQLMTKKQEAESLINHSLRSQFGENPPSQVKQLRDTQARMIQQGSDQNAQAVSGAMKQVMQQSSNQPIPPSVTSGVLSSITQQ